MMDTERSLHLLVTFRIAWQLGTPSPRLKQKLGLKQDLVHLAIALVCEITSFCRTLEVERSH